MIFTKQNSRTQLTIANINENIVISDYSRVYNIGNNFLYLCVKGLANTEIVNQRLFTVALNRSILVTGSTMAIGIGTEWNMESIGYAFMSKDNSGIYVTARVPSDKWFHINILLPLA